MPTKQELLAEAEAMEIRAADFRYDMDRMGLYGPRERLHVAEMRVTAANLRQQANEIESENRLDDRRSI